MAKACAPGPLAVRPLPSSEQVGSPRANGQNGQYADEPKFSLLKKRLGKPAPTPGTKPYTRHILGIDSGLQSHPKATTKPPQGSTKATFRPVNFGDHQD